MTRWSELSRVLLDQLLLAAWSGAFLSTTCCVHSPMFFRHRHGKVIMVRHEKDMKNAMMHAREPCDIFE